MPARPTLAGVVLLGLDRFFPAMVRCGALCLHIHSFRGLAPVTNVSWRLNIRRIARNSQDCCESAIKNWKRLPGPVQQYMEKKRKRKENDQKQTGAQNSVRPFCCSQKTFFAQSFAQKETGSSLLHNAGESTLN